MVIANYSYSLAILMNVDSSIMLVAMNSVMMIFIQV